MTHSGALAGDALAEIAAVWQLDPPRVQWIEGKANVSPGFDWWPGDYRVRVRAHAGRPDATGPEVKLTVATDFLRDIDVASPSFVKMSAVLSRFSTSTYAWVYPPGDFVAQYYPPEEAPRFWLASSAYISPSTLGWLPRFLAQATIVQPINAQIQALSSAKHLGSGLPDTTRPPHLIEAGLDGMLDVVDQVLAPDGRLPSRWIGTSEFEAFAERWGRSDTCFGNGDPTGLTLETPFGPDTALIRFQTAESHPQLGRGLLCTLQLPWISDTSSVAREVAELNYLEATLWTGFALLGCWHSNSMGENRDGVAFTLFVPNSLHIPGLISPLAAWFFGRARWVRETKFPGMEDLPLAEILSKRLGAARQQVQ